MEILNLSELGAFVQTTSIPSLRDTVTLAVGLPNAPAPLLVAGRVLRVPGRAKRGQKRSLNRGFGLRFTHFSSPLDRDFLRRHLSI